MIDVFWHPAVLDHDTGRGIFEGGPSHLLEVPELHPENAERVRNMVSVLQRGPLAVLTNTTFEMKVVEDRFPGIRFHKQREHAGLMADRIADLA